jgi:hypothetical protein
MLRTDVLGEVMSVILQKGRMLKEFVELVGNSENLKLYIAGFGILEDEVEIAVKKYSKLL